MLGSLWLLQGVFAHTGSHRVIIRRYWLQSRYTDDPRVLEMPAAYVHSRVLKHYTT